MSPEGVEALLVRHGQSTANLEGVWQGRLDYPLSEAGRDQALRAGRCLTGVQPAGIYTSPLLRASESAGIIAAEIGYPSGRIRQHADLTERGGGLLEGYAWDDFETRYPDRARRFFELPDDERWEYLGAESTADALMRLRRALEKVRNRHEPGEVVVVVSHGGLLGSFFLDHLGPEVPGERAVLANGSITRLVLRASGPSLVELGGVSHLG